MDPLRVFKKFAQESLCSFFRSLLLKRSVPAPTFVCGGGGVIRLKQVRFGKLGLLQLNGALFGRKKRDFRPFRAASSVKQCDLGMIPYPPDIP